MYMYMYMYMYLHMHMYMYTYRCLDMCTYMCLDMCAYMCMFVNMCICIYIYSRVYSYIYVYTRTGVEACFQEAGGLRPGGPTTTRFDEICVHWRCLVAPVGQAYRTCCNDEAFHAGLTGGLHVRIYIYVYIYLYEFMYMPYLWIRV